jgi:hypothetical protein
MMDFIDAVAFCIWCYWRILRTGSYPTSNNRAPKEEVACGS